MATYRVSFEVDMPDDAPEDEVQKFIEFEIGARGSLRIDCESLRHTDLQSRDVKNVWALKA
jgi:hypothetical protein